jgi:hypothetical protein
MHASSTLIVTGSTTNVVPKYDDRLRPEQGHIINTQSEQGSCGISDTLPGPIPNIPKYITNGCGCPRLVKSFSKPNSDDNTTYASKLDPNPTND